MSFWIGSEPGGQHFAGSAQQFPLFGIQRKKFEAMA